MTEVGFFPSRVQLVKLDKQLYDHLTPTAGGGGSSHRSTQTEMYLTTLRWRVSTSLIWAGLHRPILSWADVVFETGVQSVLTR